jgi:hypothetical protein
MRVFADAKQVASCAGLSPGNHESAGQRLSNRTHKGNRWLRREQPRPPWRSGCRDTLEIVTAKPTVAVLSERLDTAIKLGAGAVVVAACVAGFFFQKITDHGEKLSHMQGTLEQIVAEQKKAVPNTVGELLKQPTPGKLDAVTTILEDAKKVNRQSDSKSLEQLSRKLAAAKDLSGSPEYWQAASALISYRSATEQSTSTEKLSSCFDQKPEITLAKDIDEKQTEIQVNAPVYKSCEIELDSPRAEAIFAKFLSLIYIQFENCHIVYNGGLIRFPPNARGNLRFINCTFDISTPATPFGVGRILVSDLLSAPGLAQVGVKISGT